MADIDEDITYLNAEVLLLASDPDEGERTLRLLGAHPNVINRIATAGSKGVSTAVRCRVPLVTLSPRLEELLNGSSLGHRSVHAPEASEAIQRLTRIALQVAQRVALTDRTLAQLHFGISSRTCERLVELSVARLRRLNERHGILLRIREAEKPQIWDRLLIGDRCNDPRGFRISQQRILMSLSK